MGVGSGRSAKGRAEHADVAWAGAGIFREFTRNSLQQQCVVAGCAVLSTQAFRSGGNARHSEREYIVSAKFAEFAFRNFLEIRSGSRIGATKAAKRGRRSLDQPTPPAKEGHSRRLQLFSKQFSTLSGE
jgi:hypothetical protein